MMKYLSKRQHDILDIIDKNGVIQVSGILKQILKTHGRISRITIIRELDQLLALHLIIRRGLGRGVEYVLSPQCQLIKPLSPEDYFKIPTDRRRAMERFNFKIFDILESLPPDNELQPIDELNARYRARLKKLPPSILNQEFERLTIELSWKSSQIEGNTYSLLETETLIKEKKEAKGHKKEEAIMILNHKTALDFIRENLSYFQSITLKKIEEIHSLLTDRLKISKGMRNSPVGITGTLYRPLDNSFQIREAIEKSCSIIESISHPFLKAMIISLLIAYIQPFEDGNKRTSRMISNAILMSYQYCPLSYRSIEEAEYKKAVIMFYELNNLSYFRKLFIQQFKFAIGQYFI